MTTLGYALLGLLAREELSGYDIAQKFKMPVSFFWSARHSQIYPELARLEKEGLVTFHAVEQRGKPDKKIYTLTDAGRSALREWTTEPMALHPTRDEMVLKAYSLWLADPEEALALFREHERLHRERLARYEEFQATMERECGPDLERPDTQWFATYATLMRGLGHEREYATWCGWLADRLERFTQASQAEATKENPAAG